MGQFRRIYPVATYCEANEDEDDWLAFMEFLQLSAERIRFHKLLTRLEKLRVKRCLRDDVECSYEVSDRCNLKYIDASICMDEI